MRRPQPGSAETVYSGRLKNLANDQDDLIIYTVKATGKGFCCGVLSIMLMFPLSKFVMGYRFFKNCPANENITIYLLVSSLSTILYIGLRYLTFGRKHAGAYLTVFLIFNIIWFITGSIWIFKIYQPNYDKGNGEDYCHKHLYQFAFWITVGEYILLVVLICYLCILCHLSIDVDN